MFDISTFVNERESLRMALLLKKYPGYFIDQQFNHALLKFKIDVSINNNNYNTIRNKLIDFPVKEKVPIDFGKTMFVHFTYCSSMKTFSLKFHALWQKYFTQSSIFDITPLLGIRRVYHLQKRLVCTK